MKKRLILFLFAMLTSVSAWAEDFVVDGIYYDCTTETTVSVVSGGNGAYSGNVIIPSTVTYDGTTYRVTSIGGGAFSYCSGLTSVEIPLSVTSIGEIAFYQCCGLMSIIIPESVKSIGASAFQDCYSLTSITIPGGVTSIGDFAFSSCSGLTSVTIHGSIMSIGDFVFSGCDNLKYNEYDNALYLGNSENPYMCLIRAKNHEITSCNINNRTKVLSGDAFSGDPDLMRVEIPYSVVVIGDGAFSHCLFAKDNFINNSTCVSENYWGALIYEQETADGLLIDENEVVYCRRNATSVKIPSGVTSINGVFLGHTGLTNVEIPSSVTSIGGGAFYGCSGLTSVEIPSSVTSIGSMAFSECSGLASVTFYNSTPSSLDWGVFHNVSSDFSPNLKIYVPKDAVDTYKEAWSEYADIIFAIPTPTAVESIDAEKSQKVIKTIEDGKIVIIRNGVKWDLSGKKIDMK